MASKNGNGNLAQEYYRHMFTIRVQDVGAQGLVYASSKAYFHFRGVKDKIRQIQYKIISYTTNLIAHALIGSARQGGVPYISWPALTMVIKEVASLYITSNRETKRLERITNNIILENNSLIEMGKKLEEKVFVTGSHLISHENSWDYVEEYMNEESCIEDLIDFFEEV